MIDGHRGVVVRGADDGRIYLIDTIQFRRVDKSWVYEYGGFLKWWVSPTTMCLPTKNGQHLGWRLGKTHHLRKQPYSEQLTLW